MVAELQLKYETALDLLSEANKRVEKMEKKKQKEANNASRKRAAELMEASPELVAVSQKKNRPKRQSTLQFSSAGSLKCNEVDDAWTRCFVALDIAPHKVDSPFFRAALEATKRCPNK